jgi:hypothetical protein
LAGVGCAALGDHLRAATWPSKFRPHLPEKYDGTSNPSEFLEVYITAITAAGGDTAVMVTYFHVALSGPARTWIMNLTLGSIYSWEELYAWFTANFASAYQQHGVEAHLYAVRQESGETLRAFISRFTKVRGTIPHISDTSIITAFRQGVRDEKMLEKLATHDVETITTLFTLADKCARATEGRAWHSAPQTGIAQTGGSGAVAQDSKKKKNHNHERPPSAVPVVATATGGWNERNKRPRPQGGNSGSCPVHPIVSIAPWSAARSSCSQSVSASDTSRLPRMAPHLVAGLARRGSTTERWPRENGTSGTSPPSRSSRTSSLETPTPVMIPTAARSCT